MGVKVSVEVDLLENGRHVLSSGTSDLDGLGSLGAQPGHDAHETLPATGVLEDGRGAHGVVYESEISDGEMSCMQNRVWGGCQFDCRLGRSEDIAEWA